MDIEYYSILAMLVKTVKENLVLKTVGSIKCRYRLDHWWVSEMMLNVQSKSFQKRYKALKNYMDKSIFLKYINFNMN